MAPAAKKKVEAAVEEAPAVAPEPTTGEGEYMFSDGSSYTGAWAKSAETGLMVREGRGVYAHVAIGYKYVGEWKNDQMNGYGEFTYASGAKYAGQWVNNRYEGHGKYLFVDGSAYEGSWHDNQMHGSGVFFDTKGISWEGQFYNGTGPGLNALVV